MRSRARLAAVTAVAAAITAVPLAASSGPAVAAASCPWLNQHQSPAKRTAELMKKMTLADKISMVTGVGYGSTKNPNTGDAGAIAPNSALCIPGLVLNDAGAGMGDQQSQTTAYPDGIAQTADWNPRLDRTYGKALGREAFTKGVNVVLGPGVDIARTPLNGRNFEYAGEDPYLAGQAVASVIRGIQSRHVIATIKHYALNDQETNRMSVSADVSRRTMEEIDLPAFAAAVHQGHVGSVMCSYNRINSVYACQNRLMLRTILDRQFRFGGWVMSDWFATHSTVRSAKSGLDMEMPSGQYYGSHLQSAVQSGKVKRWVLNQMVRRILVTMFRIGLFNHVPQEGATAAAANASTSASLSVAKRVAEQGTVLLKNAKRILPLRKHGQSIALIGDAASQQGATEASQGYGSGHVPEFGYQNGVVSPQQAITNRAAKEGDTVAFDDGQNPSTAATVAASADTAIVFINDVETEGADRPNLKAHSGTCSLVGGCTYSKVNQNALVSAVAKANKHTIVVVQSGSPVAMPWVHRVEGIVENWLPGQVDGNAIAPILFGDVNPSGKLPVTFPKKLSQGPLRSKRQYPGVNNKNGIPQAHYSEGLLIGYRWYDAKHITPLFPFGFGLSYTHFRLSRLRVHRTVHGAVVRVTVTNKGSRAGAEVPQVYVADPKATGEPPLQLKAFRHVELKPGHSTTVRMTLTRSAFAIWSTRHNRWKVTPGCYGIRVGDSSAHLPLSARVPQAGGHC